MNSLILEKRAAFFRSTYWGGLDDPIRLKSLLSKLNVLTVFKPIDAGFSGMAVKVTNGDLTKRFILINSNSTIGHQHFTICHELYHLYIQTSFNSMICSAGRFERKTGEEFNADLFASYLLLPESGIKSLIPDDELSKNKITLKTILKLEHYFSCSRRAILFRLKNLNILSSEAYNKFSNNIIKEAIQFGYSTELYKPGNKNLVIGDYGEIARDLYEREIISESHYIQLMSELGLNVEDLFEINNCEQVR